MHITVFGASGGIGSHLVTLAAQRGHQVRAIYRSPPRTPLPAQAEVLITPDIFDRTSPRGPSTAPTWWLSPSDRTSPPATTPGAP